MKRVVGVDVSKDTLEVCYKVLDERVSIKGSRSFKNTLSGFSELVEWCLKRSAQKPLFVMEATGVYHEEFTNYLYDKGYPVSVVLANKIKHYSKSLNMKTKTDKSDASLIASYGLERNPGQWKPMTAMYHTLRQLCRELLCIKQDTVRAKNQLHAIKVSYGSSEKICAIKERQISFLEDTITELETEIERLAAQDPAFDARVKLLTSIPGLRAQTIIILLCETNGFAGFNNIRQVVSYAGLDVSERQSGKYQGQSRISKKGNARIRQCLFMPALSASIYNLPIKALHERIVERNPKIKKKGIVAGMRKLLMLVFILWYKQEKYDPDYQWNTHTDI